MDPQLRARISYLRHALENIAEQEMGFISLPCTHLTLPQGIPRSYQDFLRETDGVACGVIVLYESDDILMQQTPVKGLPGGRQRWFCIGTIDDNPLFLDGRMNTVYLTNSDEELDLDDSLGDLDYFLLTCVFDTGYEEFTPNPTDDAWLRFLHDHLGAAT